VGCLVRAIRGTFLATADAVDNTDVTDFAALLD
jgi:hypothetical protein